MDAKTEQRWWDLSIGMGVGVLFATTVAIGTSYWFFSREEKAKKRMIMIPKGTNVHEAANGCGYHPTHRLCKNLYLYVDREEFACAICD